MVGVEYSNSKVGDYL